MTKFSNLLPTEKPPKIFSHIPTIGKVSRNVDIRRGNSVTAKLLFIKYICEDLLCTCMYVCVYVCTHTHTHTHKTSAYIVRKILKYFIFVFIFATFRTVLGIFHSIPEFLFIYSTISRGCPEFRRPCWEQWSSVVITTAEFCVTLRRVLHDNFFGNTKAVITHVIVTGI